MPAAALASLAQVSILCSGNQDGGNNSAKSPEVSHIVYKPLFRSAEATEKLEGSSRIPGLTYASGLYFHHPQKTGCPGQGLKHYWSF